MKYKRLRMFCGLYYFGSGIAVGGNDNPIWLTGYPMSNEAQTIVVIIFLGVGAWLLSGLVKELPGAKS